MIVVTGMTPLPEVLDLLFRLADGWPEAATIRRTHGRERVTTTAGGWLVVRSSRTSGPHGLAADVVHLDVALLELLDVVDEVAPCVFSTGGEIRWSHRFPA